MCAMPLMPREGLWTVEDLDDLPDDGLQYELAEGVLLVTPSPRVRHQRMSARLGALLMGACPPYLEVFFAPLDFRPTATTSLQPDLLVVRREDARQERLTGTPLLVVEILSPATRAKDLLLKRGLYADSRVPSYWILDPMEVSATALALREGEYVETHQAFGADSLSLDVPFPVVVTPADLVSA